MVRIWGCTVVVIILDFVALCPANAQPVPFLSDSDAGGCLRRASSSIMQAGDRRFDPNASRTGRTERPPIGSSSSGNGPTIVFFVTAVELALAASTAAACWLVLAIAGICVSIEDHRRLQVLRPFLYQRLALHPVRKTSGITSRVANG
jgi:hypothetical protein